MYGVYAQNEHCEFVAVADGAMRQIKHLAKPLNCQDPDSMAADIQRVLWLAGSKQAADDPVSLVLWSDGVNTSQYIGQLQKNLGETIDVREGRSMLADVGLVRLGQADAEYDYAASLLLLHQMESPFIDFLNPHLGAKSQKRRSRLMLWITLAVVLVFIGMIAILWEWQQDRQAIRTYEQYINDNLADYDKVREIRDNLTLATGWSVGRPGYLDCFSSLAQAFPERGDIWVTNLSLKEDGTGLITGGAVDRPTILNVIETLKQSGHFSNVEMHYVHGGGPEGVSYTIEFKFEGEY
jgi:hypothetical protein